MPQMKKTPKGQAKSMSCPKPPRVYKRTKSEKSKALMISELCETSGYESALLHEAPDTFWFRVLKTSSRLSSG
jgi:hypothetical protein